MKIMFAITAITMFAVMLGISAIAQNNAFAEIGFEEKEFTKKHAPDRLLIKFKNDV